ELETGSPPGRSHVPLVGQVELQQNAKSPSGAAMATLKSFGLFTTRLTRGLLRSGERRLSKPLAGFLRLEAREDEPRHPGIDAQIPHGDTFHNDRPRAQGRLCLGQPALQRQRLARRAAEGDTRWV